MFYTSQDVENEHDVHGRATEKKKIHTDRLRLLGMRHCYAVVIIYASDSLRYICTGRRD